MSSDDRKTQPAAAGPLRGITSWPARFLIALVRGYQALLSPMFGGQCRFHPSCSEYFIQAVVKYGALGGTRRGLWRICRCHPLHPGGYDPP